MPLWNINTQKLVLLSTAPCQGGYSFPVVQPPAEVMGPGFGSLSPVTVGTIFQVGLDEELLYQKMFRVWGRFWEFV